MASRKTEANAVIWSLRRHGGGRYGRERLEIEPTPVNIKYAERLRLEILGKIERGTFALGDYFPSSPRVAKDAPSMTWAEVAAEWKKVKRGEIEHSTAHSYAQTLSSKHFADWQDMRMNALDYRALMAKLAALPQHPKTWNNIASVLSMAGVRLQGEAGARAAARAH
jgi:integrase